MPKTSAIKSSGCCYAVPLSTSSTPGAKQSTWQHDSQICSFLQKAGSSEIQPEYQPSGAILDNRYGSSGCASFIGFEETSHMDSYRPDKTWSGALANTWY